MLSSVTRWNPSTIAQTIGRITTARTISTVGDSSSRPVRASCLRRLSRDSRFGACSAWSVAIGVS
jgi:hypothetical protein